MLGSLAGGILVRACVGCTSSVGAGLQLVSGSISSDGDAMCYACRVLGMHFITLPTFIFFQGWNCFRLQISFYFIFIQCAITFK